METRRTILDENKLDKNQLLTEFGIVADELKCNGDLEKMLNLGRSRLVTAYPVIAGVCFPMQVKLSLRERSDGMLAVVPHPIKNEVNYVEYRGHRYSESEIENLKTFGHLGRTITLESRLLSLSNDVFISIDKETKETVCLNVKYFKIPDVVDGILLSDSDKRMLMSGEFLHVDDKIYVVDAVAREVCQIN